MKYSRTGNGLISYIAKLGQLVAALWCLGLMTNAVAMVAWTLPIKTGVPLMQVIAANEVAEVAKLLKEDEYIAPVAQAEFLCAIQMREAVSVEKALTKLLVRGENTVLKQQQLAQLAQAMLSIAQQSFASLASNPLMPKLNPKLYALSYSEEDRPIKFNQYRAFLLMLDTITFFIKDIKQVDRAIGQVISICGFPEDWRYSTISFAQLLLSAYARQDQALWQYCAQLADKNNLNVFDYMMYDYAIRSYPLVMKFDAPEDIEPDEQQRGVFIMLAKRARGLLCESRNRGMSPIPEGSIGYYDDWMAGRNYLEDVIQHLRRYSSDYEGHRQLHLTILEAGFGATSRDALVELVEIFFNHESITAETIIRLEKLLTTTDPSFLCRVIPKILLQYYYKSIIDRKTTAINNCSAKKLLHYLLESHPDIININSRDPESQRTVFVQALALNDFQRAYWLMTNFNVDCNIKDKDGMGWADFGIENQLDPWLIRIRHELNKRQFKLFVLQQQQRQRELEEQFAQPLAHNLWRFKTVIKLALDVFPPSANGL